VDAIVRHATRREPSERFATTREFGDEVRTLSALRIDRQAAPDEHTREVVADTLSEASDPPMALVPVDATPAPVRPRRRSKRRIVGVIVLALVLALAGAGYYFEVVQYTHAPELTGMSLNPGAGRGRQVRTLDRRSR